MWKLEWKLAHDGKKTDISFKTTEEIVYAFVNR